MSSNLRPIIQCNRCKQVFDYGSTHTCSPPIDLTIHQLAELRGAILSVIDEGRLVNGKREPWSFYPSGSGWQPIETAPDDGSEILVLDKDTGEVRVAIRKMYSQVKYDETGKHWYEWFRDDDVVPGHTWSVMATHWRPLTTETDWHMDESGDSNLQRTEFCDDIMGVLLKRIKEGQ